MSQQYTHQILKVVVAQICQTIGWHSIQSTPLELMVDILNRYLEDITKQTYRYSELYNRTEANLDDVGLAYKDMNINLSDIAEYIQYVDPVPCAVEVPKYPLKKESHMNFLKPGSKEVVTRPVHIHEYLPAINPPSDDEDSNLDKNDKIDGAVDVVNISGEETPFFKRPCSVSNSDKQDVKKQKVTFEEESRPIREISSVIMTTSGFISPARDGKLPDSKPPILHVPEERKPIIPQPVPSITPALPVSSLDGNKFSDKKMKKNKNLPEKEKKKEKIPKEILKTKKMEKLEKIGKLSNSIKSEMLPNTNGGFSSMSSFTDRIKSEPSTKSLMIPSLPPPTLPLNAGANILSEKPNNLINAIAPPPKKLGRPRKDKSAELLMNTNKKLPKLNNFLKPNPDILSSFMKPMSDFSSLPKARIDPPFMMGNLPLMPPSGGISSPFPLGGSQGLGLPIPPPSIALDEKIPSEPDKQKLNIFKKISKVKDEFSSSSSSKIDQSIIKMEPKSSNMDQVIVIDDDQNSSPLPPTPSTPNIPGFKKDSEINEILMKSEPINMSMPKSLGMHHHHHTDDFKFGIEPNRTSTPNKIPMIDGNPPPKIRKKYKTKDKANKKFDFFSEELLKADMYSQLKNSKKLMDEISSQSHASTSRAMESMKANAQQNNMMFPLLPFSTGPGLIPTPGLFPPHFNLNRPPHPFGLLPGQNFPGGLNPPLPDINNMFKMYRKPNDMAEQKPWKPIYIDKTHCNVAPLVPDSLKLEIPINSSHQMSGSGGGGGGGSSSSKSKSYSSKLCDDLFSPNQPSSKKIKLEPPSEPIPSISLSSPMASPTIPSANVLPNPFSNDSKITDFSKEIIEIDDNCSISSKDRKEDKKHKKDKKEKEGKIKKKKDKKEKLKSKEEKRSEKKKEREDKKEFKEKLKKEKKEKRKEKERAMQSTFNHDMESISSNDNLDLNSSVPRLTLKLERNNSPPVTPESIKKSSVKSIKKMSMESDDIFFGGPTNIKREREPSPELVRISPLVTRPPKPTKPMTMKKKDDGDNKANNNSSHDNNSASQNLSASGTPHNVNATPTPGRGRPKGSTKLVNAAKNLANANKLHKLQTGNGIKSPKQQQQQPQTHHHNPATAHTNATTISTLMSPTTVPVLSTSSSGIHPSTSTLLSSSSSAMANIQNSGGSNTNNHTANNSTNNGSNHHHNNTMTSNSTTIINNNNGSNNNNNNNNNHHNSNNNNNGSNNNNNNNNTGTQISTSTLSSSSSTSALPTGIRDSDGNQVWICPACGRVDDGTPMIGCDGCDAWYHWVCVGIQVPPDANEDWYCRVCIVKKQESQGGEKKKKRKKKDKKDH